MAQSDIGGPPGMHTAPATLAPDQAPSHAANCAEDRVRGSKGALGAVGRQAADTAGRISAGGRAVGLRAQAVASNLKTALDKSLEDQPTTTLAVAAIAGFVLGALSRS